MKTIFVDYLFSKHLLVSSPDQEKLPFETLFSLAKLFNIRVVSGQALAQPEMIHVAERCIGSRVPEPFYRGFPQSVRSLSPNALQFDQMLHYYQSYVIGDFSKAGFSVLEEYFEREAFREKARIKDFSVITESEAVDQLENSVNELLGGTRPLSESQYDLVRAVIREYRPKISHCASKDTAVKLLLDTYDPAYAAFLRLSDVIRILDHLCHDDYENENLKKLNLTNQDRKFLTEIMNIIFREGQCDIATCFEKKKIWNGLLHHIHYKPINETAKMFVDGIRGNENLSVYSTFEKHMQQGEIREAVQALREGKGSGALLRKLTYILSRCETEEDISFVMQNLETDNSIILLQMIRDYSEEKSPEQPRTFKFTKHNLLRVHRETKEEFLRRRSLVTEDIRRMTLPHLWKQLEKIYHGILGKVYIAPGMEKITVPLQETTAFSGFGVLPRGSRVPIQAGKKVRCFTYWEQVNDIDLSVIALTRDDRQLEFSWRNMRSLQSDAITYSGDQTRGFYGGSEYFDVDLDAFMAQYPEAQYLIFCSNVYTLSSFNDCLCRAGYMDRDILDSGEVFSPKTVATSFQVTCDSSFAYLFGIDLQARELVWLNVGRDSNARVAATTSLGFLKEYFRAAELMNMRKLFTMLATEVVENPEEADVIVSDEELILPEGAEQIHSYDTDYILFLMNM